jgi:hypothetical protein
MPTAIEKELSAAVDDGNTLKAILARSDVKEELRWKEEWDNASDWPPLHQAAFFGHHDMGRALVSA